MWSVPLSDRRQRGGEKQLLVTIGSLIVLSGSLGRKKNIYLLQYSPTGVLKKKKNSVSFTDGGKTGCKHRWHHLRRDRGPSGNELIKSPILETFLFYFWRKVKLGRFSRLIIPRKIINYSKTAYLALCKSLRLCFSRRDRANQIAEGDTKKDGLPSFEDSSLTGWSHKLLWGNAYSGIVRNMGPLMTQQRCRTKEQSRQRNTRRPQEKAWWQNKNG